MAKVVNIVETKIMKRNGADVQRVIFSNDKIVYVRLDNGDVYPQDTPDRYVDMISYYNAAQNGRAQRMQDSFRWATEHMDEFLEDTSNENRRRRPLLKQNNYIEDGTGDRQAQIHKTKRKDFYKLSKNHRTQSSINSMISFGQWLFFAGIFQIILFSAITLYLFVNPSNNMTEADSTSVLISFGINSIIAIIDIIIGHGIKALEMTPSGIQTAAIYRIIIAVLVIATSGSFGLAGIILTIIAIIALAKSGTYREWYYGEIE